jgi:hypothetical protein
MSLLQVNVKLTDINRVIHAGRRGRIVLPPPEVPGSGSGSSGNEGGNSHKVEEEEEASLRYQGGHAGVITEGRRGGDGAASGGTYEISSRNRSGNS